MTLFLCVPTLEKFCAAAPSVCNQPLRCGYGQIGFRRSSPRKDDALRLNLDKAGSSRTDCFLCVPTGRTVLGWAAVSSDVPEKFLAKFNDIIPALRRACELNRQYQDDDTYDVDFVDGRYMSLGPVGHGATEQEAIADLEEQIRERDFGRMHDSYIRSLSEKSYDE